MVDEDGYTVASNRGFDDAPAEKTGDSSDEETEEAPCVFGCLLSWWLHPGCVVAETNAVFGSLTFRKPAMKVVIKEEEAPKATKDQLQNAITNLGLRSLVLRRFPSPREQLLRMSDLWSMSQADVRQSRTCPAWP